MDPTQDILQSKGPELKDQVQQKWSKLADDDIARLNDKREELIMVLRQWHRYSRMQADRVISNWMYNHTQAHTSRAVNSTGPTPRQSDT